RRRHTILSRDWSSDVCSSDLGAGGRQATAQERSIPDFGHFAAIETLYRGNYQRALRNFNSELRSAVRTVQTRWVDSICYHAMLRSEERREGTSSQSM